MNGKKKQCSKVRGKEYKHQRKSRVERRKGRRKKIGKTSTTPKLGSVKSKRHGKKEEAPH